MPNMASDAKECFSSKVEYRAVIRYFYFILSSEIMENISAIKVVSIYNEMIWYDFTVD